MINFNQQVGNIPEELRDQKRWIVTNANKVPPEGWNDPKNWKSLEEAHASVSAAKPFVTFVLTGSKYLVLDADHIFHTGADGKIAPDQEYRERLTEISKDMKRILTIPTYKEASMSGTGCHWLFDLSDYDGELPVLAGGNSGSFYFTEDRTSHAPKIELFLQSGKNIILTGNVAAAGGEPEQDIVGGDEAAEVLDYFLNLIRDQDGSTSSIAGSQPDPVNLDDLTDEQCKLLDALEYIPSDDRTIWRKVGTALFNTGFPIEIWDAWSKKSERYPAKGFQEIQYQWQSFGKASYPETNTYIFSEARKRGWNPKGYDIHNLPLEEITHGNDMSQPDNSVLVLKPERLSDDWDRMPELKPELIEGVLREGHKLMVASSSKMGKSFLLINLAISIAEGVEWLGLKCKRGHVFYIDLELDRASCKHRFRDVYEKRGLKPIHANRLEMVHLRGERGNGKDNPLAIDKLSQAIIALQQNHYDAIIIDPIYKTLTGDENSASDMTTFCSYIDQIATETGASVIYCHHYSKGATGKYANAMDRASGSGVFARDPDAILDIRRLSTDGVEEYYRAQHPNASEELTAWELTGTLREFAPLKPIRGWFDYPLHVLDEANLLAEAKYADTLKSGKGVGKNQKSKEDWFQIVDEMLSMVLPDTAVSLEAVGISENNATNVFSTKTDYEVATVDGIKVVHRRKDNKITFVRKEYERVTSGRSFRWKEANHESQNPNMIKE